MWLWKWKCIKLVTSLWYIMIHGQQNVKNTWVIFNILLQISGIILPHFRRLSMSRAAEKGEWRDVQIPMNKTLLWGVYTSEFRVKLHRSFPGQWLLQWRHVIVLNLSLFARQTAVRCGMVLRGGDEITSSLLCGGINNQGMCRVLNLHPPPGEGWQWNKQFVIITWNMWWLFAREVVLSTWSECLLRHESAQWQTAKYLVNKKPTNSLIIQCIGIQYSPRFDILLTMYHYVS
jgi:hypothetical protein